MMHYACKCGEATAYGSIPPDACQGCDKCGTKLELAGIFNDSPPAPHDFITRAVETDEGPKPLSRCRYCHRTKEQIERERPLPSQGHSE